MLPWNGPHPAAVATSRKASAVDNTVGIYLRSRSAKAYCCERLQDAQDDGVDLQQRVGLDTTSPPRPANLPWLRQLSGVELSGAV
jgi:hypothetical protein